MKINTHLTRDRISFRSSPSQPAAARWHELKLSHIGLTRSPLLLLVAALALLAAPVAQADSFTWNANASDNWTVTTRWTPNGDPGAVNQLDEAKANMVNATGIRNITLNSATRTIALLELGGGGNSSFTRCFRVQGSGTLILDNGVNKPEVKSSSGGHSAIVNINLGGTNGFWGNTSSGTRFDAACSYTGDTWIRRGVTIINHTNVLPSGARSGDVVFTDDGAGGSQGTLSLSTAAGSTIRINGLTRGGSTVLGTITRGYGLVTVAGTVTLEVGDNDRSGTFAGVIQDGTGVIALSKIGTGTQTLSGANTYTGTTSIKAGELHLTDTGSIAGSSVISVGSGTTFDVTAVAPYAIEANQTLDGNGATGTLKGSMTLNPGAGLTLNYASGTPTLNVADGTLTLTGTDATVTVTGGPLFDSSYKLISKSGSGAVAGTVGSVTVDGAGIAGGGTPSLSIVGDELYLDITGGATPLEWGTGNGTWAVGVAGWGSGGATTFTNGNAAVFSDTFSVGNPVVTLNSEVLPQSVFASSTKHYTITGSGNIGGSAHLSKLNTGTLTLNVANTHTGGTSVSGGVLEINNAAALGDVSGTLTLEGGTLDNTSGGAVTTANHPQSWEANFAFQGTQDLNLGDGAVTIDATRTVTVNGGTLTVGGDISGSGFGLVKAGAGTLALNGSIGTGGGTVTVNDGTLVLGGNNTFTGGVTINDGELILDDAGALNSTTPNKVTFETDTDEKYLSLNGNSVTIRDLTLGVIGGVQTVIRNNHASTPVTLTVNVPGAAMQYAGHIADGGAAALALTKTGTGTFTFGGGGAGSGTYSGDTTISVGTLRPGANNIFPHGAGKGDMIIAAGATLDMLDRQPITVNGLSGSGTVNSSNKGGLPGVSVFNVGDGDASGDFSGVIQNTGSATPGTVTLVKIGTGTQTLSGVNTYSGTTTVTGGTLLVNSPGSLPATDVTVNNNATLGGDGTINGEVTVDAGGSIAPGTSAGTITLAGGLDLSGGGAYVWELFENSESNPGTDFDQIALTGGALTLNGSSTLTIHLTGNVDDNDTFWDSARSWDIITSSGLTGSSTFANIQVVGGSPAGTFNTSNDGNNVTLHYSVGGPQPVVTPVITSVTGAGTASVTVNYTNTIPGTNYTLVYNTNLNTTNWTAVGTAPAGGTSASQTDNTASGAERYYRVFYVTP